MTKTRTWFLGSATAAALLIAPIGPQVATAAAYPSVSISSTATSSNTVSTTTGKASVVQRPT